MIDVTVEGTIPETETRLSELAQHRLLIAALVLGDAVALAAAFVVAYEVRFQLGLGVFQDVRPSPELYVERAVVLIPLWLVVFALFGLYNERHLLGGTREYALAFNGCTVSMMIVIVVAFLEPAFVIARGWLLLAWLCSFLAVAGWRFSLRRLVYSLRRRGYYLSRVLIIGANEEGQALAQQLGNWPSSGLQLVGFVDDAGQLGAKVLGGLRVLGRVADLERLIAENGIRELVVATAALPRPELLEVFRAYGTSSRVQMRMSSGLFEIMTTGVEVKEVGHVSLFSVNKVRLTGIEILLKTALDYGLTVPGLVILSPLLLLIALLVRLDSPGPIIYRRRVLGVGGRQFDGLKFRTMYTDGDEILAAHPEALDRLRNNHKCENDPRVTQVGRFLRKCSLDELPQLFNVLLRQMSLVGPRMISPSELEEYGKWGMNLLTVPPGITGLWQISGRSDISYQERVQLDMGYIRNYTIWLDLQILFRTIPVVLRRKGAY